MYLLNIKKKLIIDKIHIKYNKIYNLYNIYYKTDYIKCIGISIDIKIKKYKKINHLYYIIIDDLETFPWSGLCPCVGIAVPEYRIPCRLDGQGGCQPQLYENQD